MTELVALARVAGSEDPGDGGLRAVAELRRATERTETELVRRARVAGMSWAEIAGELGVSKQTVHRKYGGRGFLGLRSDA